MSLLPTEEDRVGQVTTNTRSLKDILRLTSSSSSSSSSSNTTNPNNKSTQANNLSNNTSNNNSSGNSPSKTANTGDNDIEVLEEYLESLNHSVASSFRRLKETEEELVAQVQAGNSLTYALSYHQFAQNLAVSAQILNSTGLDTTKDILSLNKLGPKFSEESLLNKFAAKAVYTSVSEAWEEYKKERVTELRVGSSISLPLSSSLDNYPQTKLRGFGQRVLAFLQEDIDILDQVFKEIGPAPHLVHSLYHKIYTKQIRGILTIAPSVHPSSESTPEIPRSTFDWDKWSSLCLEVRKDVSAVTKEAAKICSITPSEFEQYFPVLPIFHEIALTASDLLSTKIMKTVTSALEAERDAFNQTRTFPSIAIPSRSSFRAYPPLANTPFVRKRGTRRKPPIATSVATIIRELDNVIEFITSLEFRPLIDTFVRSVLPSVILCANRLSLAARDVPQANGLEFLYISITTSAALQERFLIYEHILSPAQRSFYFTPNATFAPPTPTSNIATTMPTASVSAPGFSRSPELGTKNETLRLRRIKPQHPAEGYTIIPATSVVGYGPSLSILWECQKLLDTETIKQSDQLVSILVDSCCTHFFPNIDMNEWQDHRGFYADSRPSHGIQMLHYYLASHFRFLHHHLLSQSVQYITANTLRRCVELLLVRYSNIAPSRVRAVHFRLDITYLVAAIQTLRSACGAWYTKLSLPSLCASLISTMAVVVGPLEIVCPFLQQYSKQKQKRTFMQPPPTSIVAHPPSLEGIVPDFAAELWSSSEEPLRTEVNPLEDMQFLVEKHGALSTYQFNYNAILETCSFEFSRSLLEQLVSNRPELRDSIYPPFTDTEQQLLPILHEFLRPP